MKSRWYFCTLLIVLTLAGVVNQQQDPAPNQEIVVQFTDVEVSSDAAQRELAEVTKQLQDIGASNIQINEGEHGRLKITYYSNAEVTQIRNALSKDKNLDLENSSFQHNETPVEFPLGDAAVSYNIDIFEIQTSSDIFQGFDGNTVVEFKIDGDRFYNSIAYHTYKVVNPKTTNKYVCQQLKFRNNIAIAIDYNAQNIPEVRAGPHFKHTS